MNPSEPIRIDVVSDVVCPWCFIGKRQLEQALQQWQLKHPQAAAPEVVWHPFQLNPDLPAEGIAREAYLQRKFGRSDGAGMYDNVRRAAAAVGLNLNLEGIARQPNTLAAHALMHLAQQSGRQQQTAEALFNAYFIDGRDLTDDAVLTGIAATAGLDAGQVQSTLADEALLKQVSARDRQARDSGIGGVPFFIVNRKLAVSGAAGADHLLQALEQV